MKQRHLEHAGSLVPVKTRSVRHLVFEVLLPFEKGVSRPRHVEEQLDEGFRIHRISLEDRRFGTFLAYGVLRHWFGLEAIIRQFSKIPHRKLDPYVRLLLRIGLFQLAHMESVPDYAANATTMDLATDLKIPAKSRGYINAVLNGYVRQGKPYPSDLNTILPAWWLQRLKQQFEISDIEQLAAAYRQIPVLTLRVNTLAVTVTEYCQALKESGIPYQLSPEVPDVVFITQPQGDPRTLPGFETGWFVVQDESSARVGHFLSPQPDEIVLEFGAAPGTKTTHLAALMQNRGMIIAVDTVASRMKKLEENCRRLGVPIAQPYVADGVTFPCPDPTPHRVLIDAPCSGTGTVGKHPEILLTLKPEDFEIHARLQSALIQHGFECLRPGGTLVYSTCSIDRRENQDVIAQFLAANKDTAQLEEERLILPDTKRDGFYMARIFKRS